MWIVLSIIAIIMLLITIILLLPVTVIIKTNHQGEFIFRYKILFKTFGENPDPNQPIVKALKKITGVNRLTAKTLKTNNLLPDIKEKILVITGLLKQLVQLLKSCTVKTLKINIVCAGEDAANTVMNYGICHAVISPLLAFVHSAMKVRKNCEKINISTNFSANSGLFEFETVLATKVFFVLVALLRLTRDEAKRKNSTLQKN